MQKCKDPGASPGHASSFCEVVLRCAVAIGHVDIIHLTGVVSSSQECQEPGASPGHASYFL